MIGVALTALVLGCVPPALDLGSRRCPCTTGWTCDTALDRCVQGVLSDAAGIDAASDGATTDVGSDTGLDTGVHIGVDAASDAAHASDGGNDAFAAVDVGIDAFLPVDGGRDAGHDAGMPGDTGCTGALASALICDGFETDPGPWSGRTEHLGTVVADGVEAFRGTRGLHAQLTASGGQAAREAEGLGPFTSGDLWMRVSLYIPTAAVVSDFTWFSIGEVAPPYAGISLGMGGDGHIGSYSSISNSYVSNDGLTMTRDHWTCLELHVLVSDTAGAIEVYREGMLGASTTGIDTRPGAGFTRWAVGVDYADPTQGPIEVWLDEVALSRSRLACP